MITTEEKYLVDLPSDIVNKYGLTKTLLTRTETIYLKHVLKNIFLYKDESWLNEKLNMLQFKTQFSYFQFVTNKLRAIYKLPRNYQLDDVNEIVNNPRNNFLKMIRLYQQLDPLIIVDFDGVITNKKFHSLYKYITDELKLNVVINSANPNEIVIKQYFENNKLILPKEVYANKGKKKKIIRLKEIANKNISKIIFYIDDEKEYLQYGCLLFMYCYEYTRNGKIANRTIFKK